MLCRICTKTGLKMDGSPFSNLPSKSKRTPLCWMNSRNSPAKTPSSQMNGQNPSLSSISQASSPWGQRAPNRSLNQNWTSVSMTMIARCCRILTLTSRHPRESLNNLHSNKQGRLRSRNQRQESRNHLVSPWILKMEMALHRLKTRSPT